MYADSRVRLYLGFVPVEAVVFVVVDRRLVALMLGQVGSGVENLLGLELIVGHLLHDFSHRISHNLPDLNTHTHLKTCNVGTIMIHFPVE